MKGLLGAIQFLTRIPVRLNEAASYTQVIAWFPVVGALIGTLVGAVAIGLGELVPIAVAGAVAVVVGLLITGAFHEDGLGDIADAFGGGWTLERRMEILTDSRQGTYGVSAIASSVLLRVVCAASIGAPAAVFASFVAAHTLGRTASVVTMLVAPPATDHDLGVDVAREIRPIPAWLGILAGLGLTTAAVGWWIVPFVVSAIVGAGLVVWLAVRKIGGFVGDVLGAVEQVVECAVLVVASGLAARYSIWWA